MSFRILTLWSIVLLFAASLTSCKKDDEKDYGPDATRGYFPLTIGHYVTYEVDSVLWDDYIRTETPLSFQMRYTVSDTFTTTGKELAYKIDVQARNTDTSNWFVQSTFYVVPTANALDYYQKELRIRKLIFPVSEGNTWDGNSEVAVGDKLLGYYAGWVYRYTNVGEDYNNGFVNFTNTISVPQVDATNGNPELAPNQYADRTFAKEVYAKDVGLIYREQTRWVYDRNPITNLYFRRGYQVVMRAIDHN